jgi:DNA-binding transcriptional ArsR family regulator
VGADGADPRGPHDLRGRGALKPAKAKPLPVGKKLSPVDSPSPVEKKLSPVEKKLSPVEKIAALDDVVTAIAHPARRQILLTLHFRGGTATAGEIAARFEHAWPTTTRHLRVLEDAGLLAHEKDGRTRRYRLARDRLALVSEWLAWFDT